MFGDEAVTREILGNVPSWLAIGFYVAAMGACALAGFGFWSGQQRRNAGRPAPAEDSRPRRVRLLSGLKYLAFHEQLLRDRYAGVAHLLVFYGFFVLFVGTCLVFLEYDTPLHFFYGWFYRLASLVIDLGGLAFLVGLGMFFARRRGMAAKRSSQRILRAWWVASLGWLLALIGVTGFLVEGARIAQDMPEFERWSPVGYALAWLMRGFGMSSTDLLAFHRVLWAGHAVLCVAFFALLPWQFFSHMAYGLVSWTRRKRQALAALPVIPLNLETAPGAANLAELTRLDLLHADACTTCGRCNSVCPAEAAGKPLHPREVILGLRQALDLASRPSVQRSNGTVSLEAFVPDEALWSCTTCGACNHACPVGISIFDKIVDLRRGRVETGEVPESAQAVFRSSAAEFNPYQKPAARRMDWADGLRVPVAQPGEVVEVLYWVGCAGSFDPDARGVARAMIRILNHLGVPYRVLGRRERCTGDPARRLGEEGLFQELADYNLRLLAEHRVGTIITHCPHCFNTFLNEYPQLAEASGIAGTAWRVVHHTQFLAECVADGRLPALDASPSAERAVTFHDPCYLGRGNGVIAAPRDALRATGAGLVEMPRSGTESFCCGAGGGSMWLDVRGSERIENLRYSEARQTGAAVIATGCPFCKSMLQAARAGARDVASDGASERRPLPEVRDVAELTAEALGL